MAVEAAANVFLYEEKSLENDVVALELFDVSLLESTTMTN